MLAQTAYFSCISCIATGFRLLRGLRHKSTHLNCRKPLGVHMLFNLLAQFCFLCKHTGIFCLCQ